MGRTHWCPNRQRPRTHAAGVCGPLREAGAPMAHVRASLNPKHSQLLATMGRAGWTRDGLRMPPMRQETNWEVRARIPQNTHLASASQAAALQRPFWPPPAGRKCHPQAGVAHRWPVRVRRNALRRRPAISRNESHASCQAGLHRKGHLFESRPVAPQSRAKIGDLCNSLGGCMCYYMRECGYGCLDGCAIRG